MIIIFQTHQIMPQRRPDVSYIIGDEGGFSRFIDGLRNTVADHPSRREDVLDNLDPSKRDHPVMISEEPPVMISEEHLRWLEIKLQVQGEETSTTLAVGADSFKVIGFMNQNGNWYGIPRLRGLPHNYKAQLLDWDPSWLGNYKNILDAGNEEEVVKILDSARLGKTFAAKAVRVLSSYPDVADGDNPRLALVGLSVMVCDSARMNPLHDACARGWTGDMPMASIIYGVVTCSVYVVSGGVHASCGGGSIIILLQTTPNYCPAAFRGCKTRYLL